MDIWVISVQGSLSTAVSDACILSFTSWGQFSKVVVPIYIPPVVSALNL